MSNNISALMDESYNYSMWVELYNSGTNSEDQSDYYFTDNLSQPQKWKPLSKIIPSGGFGILWFERDERSGHANFKLAPQGGVLYLLDESGVVIDKVIYPPQYRNISYGRETDGSEDWVYFVEYSNEASNNDKKTAAGSCLKPEFSVQAGFYSEAVSVSFINIKEDETIYYTTDASEPTIFSTQYIPETEIVCDTTSCLRACSFSENKLPSNIATATYFINERSFNLPVVSIVTEQKNLTDDIIGIYVRGTNGIEYTNSNGPANWYQDWDRPANFELFDEEGNRCLNQELDIAIIGAGSRTFSPQKSLKILPRKKFGDNQLRYDFFPSSKPGHKYKGIQIRNSGNDFGSTMMRDGFMQTLIINRMDIDYLAYRPAICFINGEYYGIQNLRERSNKDYLYSNYGLDEEDFYLPDNTKIRVDTEFLKLIDFVSQNDITESMVYDQVKEMMDIESYINYMITEMYYENEDWLFWYTNTKVWKKKENGKWRWILYDTDYGFGLISDVNESLLDKILDDTTEFSILFRRLMTNKEFKDKFIRQFSVQVSSTFETNRVNSIMDSLAAKISTEIIYHKTKWDSLSTSPLLYVEPFENGISTMKTFATKRPANMLGFISNRFFASAEVRHLIITSNIEKASYKFFTEDIIDNQINLNYYKDQPVSVTANAVPGYTFKHWEQANTHAVLSVDLEYSTTLANDIHLTAVYAKPISVNEISGNEKWMEIYNATETAIDLTGYRLQKIDEDGNTEDWLLPSETIIPAKGFLVYIQGVDASKTFTWDISVTQDIAFKLFDSDGNELDYFEVNETLYSDGDEKTVGRKTDGVEELAVFLVGTKGFSNDQGQLSPIKETVSPIKTYPNPTKDIIHIETGKQNIPEVRLYTLQGKLLLSTQSKQIDLASFTNGMYLLQVDGKVVKIIKQ